MQSEGSRDFLLVITHRIGINWDVCVTSARMLLCFNASCLERKQRKVWCLINWKLFPMTKVWSYLSTYIYCQQV